MNWCVYIVMMVVIWVAYDTVVEICDRKCAEVCAPAEHLYKQRYWSPGDCYCRNNGKWEFNR